MSTRTFPALAVLLLAASCTPSRGPAPTSPRSAPAITASEATLLRRLALAAPDTAPDASLPTGGSAPAPAVTRAAAPPFAALAGRDADAARATDCLTAAVYYEARSESPDGQRAVAQVVLNRVRDRAFPGSVCGVVYQRSAKGCQFSFVCDGSIRGDVDRGAWARARAIAVAAFGGAVYAAVGAATYYHTSAVSPWWAPSLARIGQIGAHIFYGWRGAMAQALTFRRSYAGVEPSTASLIVQTLPEDTAPIAGVTIHRGTGLPTAPLVPSAAGQPADVVMVAGVRIHRGGGPAVAVHLDADGFAGGPDPT